MDLVKLPTRKVKRVHHNRSRTTKTIRGIEREHLDVVLLQFGRGKRVREKGHFRFRFMSVTVKLPQLFQLTLWEDIRRCANVLVVRERERESAQVFTALNSRCRYPRRTWPTLAPNPPIRPVPSRIRSI